MITAAFAESSGLIAALLVASNRALTWLCYQELIICYLSVITIYSTCVERHVVWGTTYYTSE